MLKGRGKNSKMLEWTPKALSFFIAVKDALCACPMLHSPLPGKLFTSSLKSFWVHLNGLHKNIHFSVQKREWKVGEEGLLETQPHRLIPAWRKLPPPSPEMSRIGYTYAKSTGSLAAELNHLRLVFGMNVYIQGEIEQVIRHQGKRKLT